MMKLNISWKMELDAATLLKVSASLVPLALLVLKHFGWL